MTSSDNQTERERTEGNLGRTGKWQGDHRTITPNQREIEIDGEGGKQGKQGGLANPHTETPAVSSDQLSD